MSVRMHSLDTSVYSGSSDIWRPIILNHSVLSTPFLGDSMQGVGKLWKVPTEVAKEGTSVN
jgi:hypothetical protein